jgi:amino acid transporter
LLKHHDGAAVEQIHNKQLIQSAMKTEKLLPNNYIERLATRYGIMMTAALVGFFLLMKAFGLEHNLELRALNIVILFSFVLMAVDRYKKDSPSQFKYLKGIGLGLLTSAIGVLTFAALVFIYIAVLNPAFMDVIRAREPFGIYLNPFLVTFTIIIEGMGSGFFASYAVMQYYKTSRYANAEKQPQ